MPSNYDLGFNPGMDCNVSYEFNPNWPTGKFIQILDSQGDIVALDDMGGVWFFDYRKGWSQANPNRIPFITTEDKDNDE